LFLCFVFINIRGLFLEKAVSPVAQTCFQGLRFFRTGTNGRRVEKPWSKKRPALKTNEIAGIAFGISL